MFFRKKEKTLAEAIEDNKVTRSYWSIVRKQFKKNRLAVWSLRFLTVLIFIALTGDFIANEKPIYCKIGGKVYFPVLKTYAVDLGLSKWESRFLMTDWTDHDYETIWMPPIPYSSTTLDFSNTGYKSPFGPQKVKSKKYWHWMGTDQLGRDVTAGMIKGTRTALLVGIVAMFIASIIGIFLGAIAGFFGDHQLKMSTGRLILNILGLIIGWFYAISSRVYLLSEGNIRIEILKSLSIFLAIMLLMNLGASFLKRFPFFEKQITIAADLLVMRFIEIVNSVPALFILLAVLSVVAKSSIFIVMVVIGGIAWTGIARFIRAELIRVRAQEYIQAAHALGYRNWRTLVKHAIPNALTPVLITISFGIAGAVLVESSISFLGIGVPPEEITWGKLLALARNKFSAWWLALFPGLAIFITVTVFNLIGEGLTDALDPRLKQ